MNTEEIFNTIINQGFKEEIKVVKHLDFAPRLHGNKSTNVYKDSDGNIGVLVIALDDDGAYYDGTLEDVATEYDLTAEDMQAFNDKYGVPYNDDIETLEQLNIDVYSSLKPFNVEEVNALVNKPDAVRAAVSDHYIIKSMELFEDNKIAVATYADGSKKVCTVVLPASDYNELEAKDINSMYKALAPKKVNDVMANTYKYELYDESQVKEMADGSNEDFETLAAQLFGDFGLFENYETFNANNTNYVLVTKK